MGYDNEQAAHLTLMQSLNALTEDCGGVFVSLWEPWEGSLYAYYSAGFTNDPAYPSLAVNGDFDHTNYNNSLPADGRYLFDKLKDRILSGH